MFIAIFNYIEHLFSKIKPQKLFFMAIDGVAPRAKMNQQRARRFRTALDAEVARNKAIQEGVEMPKEDPFDSNCITPGTDFMTRLSQHLRYFVNKKVSEDTDWQGVEIILSGHEVPGEGEHKIMEYIRQAKAQKNYDPNMRHCLYGLDADLIMLGLLSHDPHFCLLREEVTFGRQSKSKSKELEHQNFYLMHLCIVREYLELEFQELKEPGAMGFPFDMERVIDDFILMAFFVGNDFLPNLPHLHINEGALALMFGVYKSLLPKAGGYINEGGVINLPRLKLLLDELSHVEFRFFEAENHDAKWFKGKRMEKEDVMVRQKRKHGKVIMSTAQQKLFQGIDHYVSNRKETKNQPYDLPSTVPAEDRKFVEELADSLHMQWATVENEDGNRHMTLSFPPSSDSDAEDSDDEADHALARVLNQYRKATIVDISAEESQAQLEQLYDAKFKEWKNNYYQSKFGWDLSNEAEMRNLAENYVQGLQWVLYYYYRGIASWPWFFKFHYSPMISDVHLGLNVSMDFELGQPFLPFQQLMGVLPDRSKKIVPTAYWDLMTNPKSPIIDFYPRDFELDMNGKKMEWEAVVKIPFIEEKRLLDAMKTKDDLLSPDEKSRNGFGVTLKFTYQPEVNFAYQSSLPGYFPDVENCHCVENIYELPTMDGLDVYVGLMDGAYLGVQALAGFPSLKTLPFHAQLGFHGVNVFQQDSRNESMVVTILDAQTEAKVSAAQARLNKSIYIGYPFLQEAKVVRVSDELFDYVLDTNGQVAQLPHQQREIEDWQKKADRIQKFHSKKLGVVIGEVESLVHVENLRGVVKRDDGSTVKDYGNTEGQETDYATQTIVDEVFNQDPRFIEEDAKPIEVEFPINSRCFFLGDYAYGRPVVVDGHQDGKVNATVLTLKGREPEFGRFLAQKAQNDVRYIPSYAVAKQLQLHPLALAKMTSSLSVESNGLRLNLGLNLKFEARKLKVLGYSRKSQTGWEFSPKAVDLITQYMIQFPELVALIASKPKGDIYKDTEIYPHGTVEEAKKKIKEIGQWLKASQSRSFETVPLDADQLDSDAVAAIEAAAVDNLSKIGVEKRAMKGVPRHALLNPNDADKRVGGQRFILGDRVVYVLATGKVPIAQRGTVVGITRSTRQTWLDVVFDQSFMSGTTLGDRCSPFHGATIPGNSVLNLSASQVVALSKAAAARQTPAPGPKGFAGYAQGANGLGMSRPANAPPPLAGSFRAAASGLQSGPRGGGNFPPGNGYSRGQGRGSHQNGNGHPGQLPIRENNSPHSNRGAGPRGGRGGPRGSNRGRGNAQDTDQAGNPGRKFPAQSYNAVPPPAALTRGTNVRGRGDGRGARGGRGGAEGRGRGRGAGPTDGQQEQSANTSGS
jgi:5'-3' exoribonuclease 1